MRAKDVMTRGVLTVRPDSTVEDAWGTMQKHGVHHLAVKDQSKIVGMLSSGEITGPSNQPTEPDRPVREVMARTVVTVEPSATLRKVANLIRGRASGYVIVMDRGRPVGIITIADVLEVLGRGATHANRVVERRALSFRTPHRHKSAPTGTW